MLSIVKQFKFCAGHSLPKHAGKCRAQHGHNFVLEVEVGGKVNDDPDFPSYGMIMDFGDLKKIVNRHIIDKLDHSYLNDHFHNPTAENVICWIAEELQLEMDQELLSLRLYETDGACCVWRREG